MQSHMPDRPSHWKTEVCAGDAAFEALREEWNALVQDDADTLLGMDGTTSHEWFLATVNSLARDAQVRVVTCRSAGQLVGVLPVAFETAAASPLRLRTVTTFYSGRAGFMLRDPDPHCLLAMFNALQQFAPRWRRLDTMLVTASRSEAVALGAAAAGGLGLVWGEPMESPAFPLTQDAAAFRADITKNLKQNLQKARNRIKAGGSFEIRTYRDVETVDELMAHVLTIDRGSWKHEAGSAISANPEQERFYRQAFPRLAQAGLLYAQVFLFDGQPAAHNFGLCRDGVYSCLKHSQAQAFDHLSPGLVLNEALIDALRALGIQSYDYMGKAEEHKLRWSKSSRLYARRPLSIYRDTWLAQAERAVRILRDRGRARFSKRSTAGTPPAADAVSDQG